jgi:hypothetical protein
MVTRLMIAPCGINCAACGGHLQTKNRCGGCLPEGEKGTHCRTCRIKFCDEHSKAAFTYCFECGRYPCARLKNLYMRYREKYGLDIAANQAYIKEYGMEKFLEQEGKKWACAGCGAALNMHRAECPRCGRAYR